MPNILGHKGNVNQKTRFHLTPVRNGYHQEHKQQQMLVRMRGKVTLLHCWQKYKLVQCYEKQYRGPSKNLKIELPFDPAMPFLGIYPKECALGYNRATCTPMFIAALFIIVKIWKQSRCPMTAEWIKKMWYIYTMQFYSATKRKIMLFAGKWIELENFMLNKIGQAQKIKGHMFSFICGS
jgi:hypothetical protein